MAQPEPAKTSSPPGLLLGLSRWQAGRIAILLWALLVGLRAASEIAMMHETGPDPQMPIWLMFLLVKLGLWLLGGAIAVGALIVMWPKPLGTLAALVALLVWAVAIGRATWSYNTARQALADAADPTTSPERLRELIHFDGLQAGYELDNRLAAHRRTPPEALRELSHRVDQTGTQMILSKNPRTPNDVLERLHRADR
jgi:hypothetical protein